MTLAAANAHEIIWSEDPGSRIVFADDDPLVLAHARALMRPDAVAARPDPAVGYVPVGLRDPGAIIAGARATLDFSQPIAVVLFFVLAFIDDTPEAAGIVSALADALPSGSHVAVHHIAGDLDPSLAIAARRWNQQSPQRITLRSRAEVQNLVDGLEPVPPGLVLIEDWRPSGDAPRSAAPVIPLYGVVARKPLAPRAPAVAPARPPRAGRCRPRRRVSGPRPRSGTDARPARSVRVLRVRPVPPLCCRDRSRRNGPRNRAAAARRTSSHR